MIWRHEHVRISADGLDDGNNEGMTGERTILRGTNVVDVHDGGLHRDVDINIDGGRIASITQTSADHPDRVAVVGTFPPMSLGAPE